MDHNLMLIERVQQGDSAACELFCSENMNLVKSIALRFRGRGCEMCDLVQIGSVGLMKAIKSFDTTRGLKFSTYAVPVILCEIKRFLRDDGMIHVSRGLKEKKMRASLCEEHLRKTLGREPTLSEISAECGISISEIAEAYSATRAVDSYDRPTDSGDDFSMQIIDNSQSEDTVLEKIALNQLLSQLNEREHKVIILRYMEGKTQEEAAKIVGVSQVHISRIERSALNNLRTLASE